mgnify:CR=1 FL=1
MIPFKQDFKLGDKCNSIVDIQYLFTLCGYNVNINGEFDSEFEKIVKDFQEKYNINSTGIIDEETLNKLNKVSNKPKVSSHTLSLGDTGTEVTLLQKDLEYLHITGQYDREPSIDGVYSRDTQIAVKHFQEKYGLEVTGIYSIETYIKMRELLG